MNLKTFTCIVCPAGCRLSVSKDGNGWTVEGNKCERGRAYAVSEMSDPRRTVTAVVRTDSKTLHFAPLRTTAPIPKNMVFKLLKEIYAMEAKIPFKERDVLIKNFDGSGVDVIFTRGAES